MKRLVFAFVAFALVYSVGAIAQAGNVAEGIAVQISGGLGSFFAPEFSAVGTSAVYKGGSGPLVRAADGCLPGDKYKLIVKSDIAKQKTKWISSGSLKCDCTASSTLSDSRDISLSNAKKVKLKAIELPGGAPATAFVTMQGSWTQKRGRDSCFQASDCTPPPYNPEKWNDGGSIQYNNNCYNYANDEITMTFAQPGRACGDMYAAITCSEVYDGANCDGLVPISSGSDSCPDDMNRVYLVIWPGTDYHWYRQDTDGRWSHKPGGTQATNRDSSGSLIYNPETADTGRYTVHCGYMCACGDNADIQ